MHRDAPASLIDPGTGSSIRADPGPPGTHPYGRTID